MGKSSFLRQRQAELFGSCLLSYCCTKDFHHRLPLIGSQWISYINQNIVSWKSTLTWKWAMCFMSIAFQKLSLMFHVGFINTLLAALNYSAVPVRICNEIQDQNHTAKSSREKRDTYLTHNKSYFQSPLPLYKIIYISLSLISQMYADIIQRTKPMLHKLCLYKNTDRPL